MEKDILKRQGRVLIPAIAYGDAAGLPVETWSVERISERFPQGVHELIPTNENPFFGSSENPGTWSDDTQLSIAVAKALIKAKRFDITALAESHLEAYDATDFIERERNGVMTNVKRGWGGSTTDAMEKLHAGVSPLASGTVGGQGNGVLMKMAPLRYWQYARQTPIVEIYAQLDQLTTMTHDSNLTRAVTKVHGDVLGYLLRTEQFEHKAFISVLHAALAVHSFMLKESGPLFELFSFLEKPVTKETILENTDGKGFHAPQTLAMAYGAFMAHEGEFTPSVYEAVNLGGDTDSIASIVATMSAFKTKGILRMPIDHQNIERIDMLKSVSRQLVKAAFEN